MVGVGPVTAGLALIPGTLPIILAGPLAGRLFDRVGGRWPLAIGFLVLALSGLALAVARGKCLLADSRTHPAGHRPGRGPDRQRPGRDERDRRPEQGAAAGIINTAEQVGGAVGIAVLSAIQLGYYFNNLYERLAAENIVPTAGQVQEVHDYIAKAEQRGIEHVPQSGVVAKVFDDLMQAHIDAFQVMFVSSAGIAVVGAIACLVLVRRQPRELEGPVFGRRSRWIYATQGRSGAITRHPPDTP